MKKTVNIEHTLFRFWRVKSYHYRIRFEHNINHIIPSFNYTSKSIKWNENQYIGRLTVIVHFLFVPLCSFIRSHRHMDHIIIYYYMINDHSWTCSPFLLYVLCCNISNNVIKSHNSYLISPLCVKVLGIEKLNNKNVKKRVAHSFFL